MAPEVLEAIFVQREPLAKRIVSTIRASARSSSKHHWLLVGPRGIGKTHLVSIVYHRLAGDAKLKKKLAIAWLREDSWEIASYRDLIDAILRSLGQPAGDDHALRSHLAGRTLLLIVENLNEVFDAVGIDGQRSLRAFVETYDSLVILATTPSLFSGVSLHRSPFYGFFGVEHLSEFDLPAAMALLERVAVLRGDTGLQEFLETETAWKRLRVVAELAGGHPRIWVLFANCLSVDLIDELVPLFLKMLDDLTPYYQERMRFLPPQQRRIVMQLVSFAGAQPVRDISAALRLDQRAVAKQLGDLERKGFVRKAELRAIPGTSDARLSAYELREPLLRLTLDVKERRGEPLRLIVAFLRSWYSRSLFEVVDLEPLAAVYVAKAKWELLTQAERLQYIEWLGIRHLQAVGSQLMADEFAQKPDFGRSAFVAETPGLREWLAAILARASNAGTLTALAGRLAATTWLITAPDEVAAIYPNEGPSPFVGTTIPLVGGRCWLDIWSDVAKGLGEFEVPLRLLQTAVLWAEDHDRRHILALPAEERRIFLSLLTGGEKAGMQS